ncbi:MAG: energy-coupling factor ABC transporter permease [Bacteroides sp.]|nr:energy-coupling factor ABC transporter permease [Bacteroides sp.]
MHMSDALVSPPVAGVAGLLSASLLLIALRKVKKDDHLLPLMGIMGAFTFAVQMINFTIPGTGSSGHIIGGILLAALLGPWAGFITLSSVLILQCFLFADGGLLALGCNIFNMAACSCLIAYPLAYRPLVASGRLFLASVTACVVALMLGAFAVTLETTASEVTALPFSRFLLFMLPIHGVIGIGEGVATAAVLSFLLRHRPELFQPSAPVSGRKVWIGLAVALALAVGGYFWASSLPDGLEWSIEKTIGE